MMATKDGVAKLRSLGYLGGTAPPAKGCGQARSRRKEKVQAKKPSQKKSPNPPGNAGRPNTNADWTHFNAVDYNPELDQIVISVHAFSEIWIIDHSTTTAEAAGHKGGRAARGATCSTDGATRVPIATARRWTAPVQPAQRPVDPARASRRGAYPRLQQRQRPAGRRLFVGRRDRPSG